jgi:LL-diaminopimelate aminotransferase
MATVQTPRNETFAKLSAGYLFPIIGKKRREYAAAHPDAKIISCGVGDTTHPLPHVVAKAMADYSMGLATQEGYSGYDPVITDDVKKALLETMYSGCGLKESEFFISDGSKCDLARFQTLFKGEGCKVAIPDPAYPAYVDDSVISGMTGCYKEGPGGSAGGYEGITYLTCTKETNFFPDISKAKDCNIIYFCNPNNPTGACATRAQLEELVKMCVDNKILLIYDAAYAYYIKEEGFPKTIYEIPGAKSVAIETNSFSKLAGFTGVRLGWTVVPSEIKYADGSLMTNDYNRIFGTHFNGAANVSLAGGLAVLQNMDEVQKVLDYYKENTNLILSTLSECGFGSDQIVGGKNSPYIFVEFPGKDSWDVFDKILDATQVITTPGVGFGPSGQSYVRISSYGKRENIVEACKRFKEAGLSPGMDLTVGGSPAKKQKTDA